MGGSRSNIEPLNQSNRKIHNVKRYSKAWLSTDPLKDNGSNFTSKVVSQINSSLCINHNFSAPYHPETNGSIERVNGTPKSILRQLVEQNSCSWEPYVPLSLLAYRSAVHSSTLKSPFDVIYGRKVVLPGTLEL